MCPKIGEARGLGRIRLKSEMRPGDRPMLIQKQPAAASFAGDNELMVYYKNFFTNCWVGAILAAGFR